jgi:PDZ domain
MLDMAHVLHLFSAASRRPHFAELCALTQRNEEIACRQVASLPQRAIVVLMEKRMRRTRLFWFGKAFCLCLLILLAQRLAAVADDRPWIGMEIVDCRIQTDFVGVAVLRIEDDAPALAAGMTSGDIVIAMDGQALESAEDFICRVMPLKPGEPVRLTVRHGEALRFPVVTLGMWPLTIPQGSHSCPMHVSLVTAPSASRG